VEAGLDALLGDTHAVTLSADELAGQFPPGALTPDLMRRAAELGLVELADDGDVRVPDRRFIDTGSSLAHLGVPLGDVLDDWEALVAHTDEIAALFVRRFEEFAPTDWSTALDSDAARRLAAVLGRLHHAARQVVAAALDASLARAGRARLEQLLEPAPE